MQIIERCTLKPYVQTILFSQFISIVYPKAKTETPSKSKHIPINITYASEIHS
jgi:hypothetical protein